MGLGKSFEERIEKEKLHLLEINERQGKAIEYVRKKGSISRQEYMQINHISHTIAHKELKELVEKEIFRVKGAGKYLKYELTQG